MKSITILAATTLLLVTQAQALGPCKSIPNNGVAYLPKVDECGGKAGVLLSGAFYRAFSVVTRDCNNNDRDPCYKHLGAASCASNYSSPFKAIKKISARVTVAGDSRKGMLYCFRESGLSNVYQRIVRRITIKMRNPVTSDRDIRRYCLPNRSKATAKVSVDSVISTANIGSTGYSAVCATQKYLACDISYCSICDSAATHPSCN